MIHDMKRTALDIVAKMHPEKTPPEPEEEASGLDAAAEDVLAACKSGKADDMKRALLAFNRLADSEEEADEGESDE